jgi:hypothetical protein
VVDFLVLAIEGLAIRLCRQAACSGWASSRSIVLARLAGYGHTQHRGGDRRGGDRRRPAARPSSGLGISSSSSTSFLVIRASPHVVIVASTTTATESRAADTAALP